MLAKGLAGDEMSERVSLVIDGVDGRVHHMEFDPPREEVGRGMIVEAAPAVSGPRPADRNIAIVAENDGVYRPSAHLERIRESFERQGKDPDAFVASMSAGWRRCAGPGMSNASTWTTGACRRISSSAAEPMTSRETARRMSTSSPTGLDQQIVADQGFGQEVKAALEKRKQALVKMCYAVAISAMAASTRPGI